MRVVHVADFVSTELGYQELLLAKWHARCDNEVHLVTSNLNPPAPDYEATLGRLLGPRALEVGVSRFHDVTIHRLPARLELRTRVLISRLAKTLRDLRPDALFVHGVMSPTALITANVGSRMNVPVFVDNHMVFSLQDISGVGRTTYAAFRPIMEHFLAPRVEKFYGVADECSRFLIDALGVPRSKVGMLPIGVDPEIFSYDAARRADWRACAGIPSKAVVIAQTGKLDANKDAHVLAAAAAAIMKRDPSVYTVLVGSSTREQMLMLQSIFRESGVDERLVVREPVPVGDLAAVFSAADIVAFPGGISLSCLEAAACGRVVVMNDHPTSRWRAGLGIGATFETGDAKSLQDLLEKYVNDPESRARTGDAAVRAAISEFSCASVAAILDGDMRRAVAAK